MNRVTIEELKIQETEMTPPESKDNEIGITIRSYRKKQGKSAVDLAKDAGIDPRTLAAIESGRIKNPSIQKIQAVAKALGISPAEFFYTAEAKNSKSTYHGSQKGEFYIDATEQGYRIISFIPIIPDFFAGKVILRDGGKLSREHLRPGGRVFIQVIFGKLTVEVCERQYSLKEGSHFLLDGQIPYEFQNHSAKECSFLLFTTPSFLGSFS